MHDAFHSARVAEIDGLASPGTASAAVERAKAEFEQVRARRETESSLIQQQQEVVNEVVAVAASFLPVPGGKAKLGEAVAAKGIPKVTEKGLMRIESHLGNLGALDDGANQAMLARLRGGQTTSQDIKFYMHELKESARMKSGLSYDAAHKATLEWQGIPYKPGFESNIYHSDVIRQFSDSFNPAAWPK